MAKSGIKEKEIIGHLSEEGFKEVRAAERQAKWHKKASEHPSCLKAVQRKKVKR